LSLHKQFATRGEKKMYGMISEWTIRSTFLLNSKWEILKERRNVNALWHVARVMKELWLTK
jgi:peroxiredoxin